MSVNHALEVVRCASTVQTDNAVLGEMFLIEEAAAAIHNLLSLRRLHGNPQGLYRIIVQFVLSDGAE